MIIRLFQTYIIFLKKREVNDMAAVYTTLIIKGLRTFASVPSTVKEKVREMLIALEMEELIQE